VVKSRPEIALISSSLLKLPFLHLLKARFTTQPGTTNTLDTGGDYRLLNAIYRGNLLYTSNNTSCVLPDEPNNTYACANFLAFNDLNGTPKLEFHEMIGASRTFHSFPAFTVNNLSTITLIVSRTSNIDNPSLYVTSRFRTGSRFAPLQILASGRNYYQGTRWGDYFGAALDPTDLSSWLYGEYIPIGDNTGPIIWGTHVGQTNVQ
jgi:hypothetical protein